MKEEGVELLYDTTSLGVIGPWGAIPKLPFLVKLMNRFKKRMLEIGPDLTIMIDTPAASMRLGRFAKAHGLETMYYFPPSAFYSNTDRALCVSQITDHIIPTFAYTVDVYKKAGVPFRYFGHPLLDVVLEKLEEVPSPAQLGLPGGKTFVAFLPGSRPQEINSLMPLYIKVMRQLLEKDRSLHFLIPVAMPKVRSMIGRYLSSCGELPCTVLEGGSYAALKYARAAVLASGSASLEAAVAGVPMAIVYKLTWPDWCFGKLFVKYTFFGLPNLIMQKKVVPEFLQLEACTENIVPYISGMLEEGERRRNALADLDRVRETLGEPGVISRVADYAVRILESGESLKNTEDTYEKK